MSVISFSMDDVMFCRFVFCVVNGRYYHKFGELEVCLIRLEFLSNLELSV